MDTTQNQPEAKALYSSLQREVRAAIARCANGLGEQYLRAPATPDEPMTSLSIVLRGMLTGPDYLQLAQRLLMVLAEQAKSGDAVALFTIERIATHYAAREVSAMFDAGLLGTGVSDAAA